MDLIHKAKLRTHKKGGFIMKKTKIIAGLMSAIMSGALAVVPTVYAEDDISVPFSVTIDNPDLTTGYFSVIFKNDYSKEMIENSIIPELINSVGENLISNIITCNTYNCCKSSK